MILYVKYRHFLRSVNINIKLYRCSSSIKVLAPGYQPKSVENGKIEKWSKELHVPPKRNAKKFSMILPPPNVTGDLHLGHALTSTIQDVLARWNRLKGNDVVWVPGTDHAGIATQVVVEKRLEKERKLTRHDLGRNDFLKEIWKWKDEKSSNISDDLKKMGASLNWEQEYFTMDPKQSEAVKEAFIRLFEKGLIYRAESLINWSCQLESTISDIEVENIEIFGPTEVRVPGYEKPVTFGEMTNIAYKFYDDPNEMLIVSTTRPETLLGDVAVAVNPNDSRYAHLVNRQQKLWHPIRKEEIPIIFDATVDPEFGTGAVKITPAHDKNDYEMAKRHSLPMIQVITEKGLIAEQFEGFKYLPRFSARIKMLHYLSESDLLMGIRPHVMSLPICSRSKDVIEFLLRPQWFIKCDEMALKAKQAVENGKIKIIPNQYATQWGNWLENSKDWCISRQLWWGHQVPAYEAKINGKSCWTAAKTIEEARRKLCLSENHEIIQDPDVLDTWFSSSLLPFSAFGWPETTDNLEKLDIMETGHDILLFWVAKMVMLGEELTEKLPFNTILLHGIISDAEGRKMSKSLGNVITPDQIINGISLQDLHKEAEKSCNAGILSAAELKKTTSVQKKMFPKGIPACGTDALRFTLCSYNIQQTFINFVIQDCHNNRLFFNKIWQATRYTLNCVDRLKFGHIEDERLENFELLDFDKWILSHLSGTIKEVENAIETYNFHFATSALKTFFYNNLCDVYLETTKIHTSSNSNHAKASCVVLLHCLSLGLKYMGPFTPFLTDELKDFLPQIENFDHEKWSNKNHEKNMDDLLEICATVRAVKSQNNILKKHDPVLHILPNDEKAFDLIVKHKENIRHLTFSTNLKMHREENVFKKEKFHVKSTSGHLCTFGIVAQIETIKESTVNDVKLQKLQVDLEKFLKIVNNQGYQKNADENKKQKLQEKINQLKIEIKNFQKMI